MPESSRRLELPGYIQIEVTSRCNLSCSACPHGAPGLNLDDQEIPRVIFDRLVESTIRPGQRYHLQGWGEPLLRGDLPELARFIADRGGLPSVTTNGTLITAELADRLIGSGLDFGVCGSVHAHGLCYFCLGQSPGLAFFFEVHIILHTSH